MHTGWERADSSWGLLHQPDGLLALYLQNLSSQRRRYAVHIQVLGVNRAASKESCLKASEQLLAAVPDVGYSAELLLSRALVLETASNVLMDYTARRAYDRAPQIEVSYHDLPGKLCPQSAGSAGQPAIACTVAPMGGLHDLPSS